MSTTTDLKELYNEYIEAVWNQKDLQAMDKFFTEDTLDHDAPPGQAPGLAGLKAIFAMLQAAFPDWCITTQILLQEGDLLAVRQENEGTHQGDFFGIPATRRSFHSTGTHIYRCCDGKIAEHWSNADDLGMLQQLGAIQLLGH